MTRSSLQGRARISTDKHRIMRESNRSAVELKAALYLTALVLRPVRAVLKRTRCVT